MHCDRLYRLLLLPAWIVAGIAALLGLFAQAVLAEPTAALTRHCSQLAEANVRHAALGERYARHLLQGEARYASKCAMFGDWRALAANPTKPSRCDKLEQEWLEERRRNGLLRRSTPDRGWQYYQRECPGEAKAALAALEAPASAAEAQAPTPVRVATPGRYADWRDEIERQCHGASVQARTGCAQLKIDRALAEGRLTQLEIDTCAVPAKVPASRDPARDARQHETAARRWTAVGGDALRKWEKGNGGCGLVERVRLTFADPGEHLPGTFQSCGHDSGNPQHCDLPADLVMRSYAVLYEREYRACMKRAKKDSEREACDGLAIGKALAAGVVSQPVLDACRGQSSGATDAMARRATNLCLLKHSRREAAGASRILRAVPRPPAPMLALQGYQRPGHLELLYAADWPRLNPPEDFDLYALNFYGDLGEACPDTGYVAVMQKAARQRAAAAREALQRAATGKGTMADLDKLLFAAGGVLAGMEDCGKFALDWERDACEEQKLRAGSLPSFPEARQDARRWLARYACGTPETRRLGEKLGEWVLLREDARGGMAWAAKSPRRSEFEDLFENCRRQSGGDSADAWCGCYVRAYSQVTPSPYTIPADQLDAARRSAFVGTEEAWPELPGALECRPRLAEIAAWRRRASHSMITACLTGQQPLADSVTPGLLACRYATAWGEIEMRSRECRPRLYANQWGDTAVPCP